MVVFRGDALEVVALADRLGFPGTDPQAGVVVWAGGRRRSALREVGNILASSYLNAVVEMTGLDLSPQPPSIEVDLLGSLVSRSLESNRSDDPTVLMRSVMTVEASDTSFAFLFVPQFGAAEALLDRRGRRAARFRVGRLPGMP